ncbi:MAG: YceI family protein [Rhodothalassiaceae bacterium]
MIRWAGLLLLPLFTLSAAADERWDLVPERSAVSFVTLKNAEIAEASRFRDLAGYVDADGRAEIRIKLASVDTKIGIRDERMRKYLFEVDEHPVATIRAEIDAQTLADLPVGERITLTIPVRVAAHGQDAAYDTELAVTRVGEDLATVTSVEPVIVYAEDFDYAPGLGRLREIAGLDSIQFAVPISFDLTFRR